MTEMPISTAADARLTPRSADFDDDRAETAADDRLDAEFDREEAALDADACHALFF